MINLGIIGCGHWGSNHIRVFNTLKDVKVKVCADKDASRLDSLRSSYPGITFTSDLSAVTDNDGIDAVVIATPTASHYALVKTCLLNNKHVLCEKPVTVKSKESRELSILAEKKQKLLMIGYVFLYNNGIIAFKEYLKSKTLGRVLYLHFTRTNLGPIRDDVDVIYDLASHDIAIASFLLGSWPVKVCASAGFFLRKNISDLAFITLYYPKNIVVNLHVSWLDPRKIRRLICVGNKKMALWDDLDNQEPLRIFDKGVIKEPFYSDYGEFQLLPREGEVISPAVKLAEPLKKQNSHFIESIKNKKKPLTDIYFAHKITQVLQAIETSLKNCSRTEEIF